LTKKTNREDDISVGSGKFPMNGNFRFYPIPGLTKEKTIKILAKRSHISLIEKIKLTNAENAHSKRILIFNF